MAKKAQKYTDQWGSRLRELADKYGFDVNAFCSTKVPNQPQIRFGTGVSWFRGDRFPDAQKLAVAQKIVSILAKKKVTLKELLDGVDVPTRTRIDLETITGEKW